MRAHVENMAKKVTVLDAIHMTAQSGQEVKVTTISNCFKKAFQSDGRTDGDEGELDSLADVPVLTNMAREEFEVLVDKDVANS